MSKENGEIEEAQVAGEEATDETELDDIAGGDTIDEYKELANLSQFNSFP